MYVPLMCYIEESKVPKEVMEVVRNKTKESYSVFTDWFVEGYKMTTKLKDGDFLLGKVTFAMHYLDD
jgi:hypothetical protein